MSRNSATPRKVYRVIEGSLQDRFDHLRVKIQVYAGGFGNGKTAAAVVLKTLRVARDYPGANILVARETFPKLNDTIRKEFLKWCPPGWIKSFPMSANASNTCTLPNGSSINFRYIAQQGRKAESTTSNQLSATYDLIVVDQMEDPGIMYKDFIDLLGRLRGQTPYQPADGQFDPTMPRTGPRWLVFTCNPTRNWLYRRIKRPLELWQTTGIITDDLLCIRDPESNEPILDEDGQPTLIIEIIEGSTYENRDNLPDDFITTLEATYRGQMRGRYLLGKWEAYEGLIYPEFDEVHNGVTSEQIMSYYDSLCSRGYSVPWIAGYDYGIANPSCFVLGFVDPYMNVILVDGFYEAEMEIEDQRIKIGQICQKHGVAILEDAKLSTRLMPEADPDIFRRKTGSGKVVGNTVADLFRRRDLRGPRIHMRRADNAVLHGITKMRQYVQTHPLHINPFTGNVGAPFLYYNIDLRFISDESGNYMWRTATSNSLDERDDEPRKGHDHAMDAVRYALARRPAVAVVNSEKAKPTFKQLISRWHETSGSARIRNEHRYRSSQQAQRAQRVN